MGTIKSGLAMLKVLEDWGVKNIYGIPGGSINSTMEALYESKDKINYIQVRHEEVGAIAAAAESKLTGKIGVCFGSAGPGATHLFNGLYDAKLDKTPLLAIIGQVSSKAMNMNAFQEINENPMFTDVSVYNRTVTTPENLPYMIDEAIRVAYEQKGVSVLTLPVDFGYVDIPDNYISSAKNYRVGYPCPQRHDIEAAVKLIEAAERPVLYIGRGTRGGMNEVLELSNHYSMPIVMSVMAKGIVPDNEQNLMGSAARLSTKPANEALAACDLILFVGSDFPFARFFFPANAKFIQIDSAASQLGKRHKADVAILADAKEAMAALVKAGAKKPVTKWLEANRQNRQNWVAWLKSFEDSDETPLRYEPVLKEVNRIAQDNAIFIADVGNCTIFAVRNLEMNGKGQQFTTSGLFATMGYGVPGGIAAKLAYPKRQVITLNGDGAFAMVMQDIITQVRYNLAVINIIFSNDSLGFIDAEQEDTNKRKFGVDLQSADYAKAAQAMGAKGFSVTKRSELAKVFDEAAKSTLPVVIDVKIGNTRPFPAEKMQLDTEAFSKEQVDAFIKRYEVKDMPLLKDLLK